MTLPDTIENRFDVDIVPPPTSIQQVTNSTKKGIQPCRACGKLCMKRNGPLVKALGEIYHYQCFVCEVYFHLFLWGNSMGKVKCGCGGMDIITGASNVIHKRHTVKEKSNIHLLDSRYQGAEQ